MLSAALELYEEKGGGNMADGNVVDVVGIESIEE